MLADRFIDTAVAYFVGVRQIHRRVRGRAQGGGLADRGAAMNAGRVTIRTAAPADQDAIRALVKRERLNPSGLHWPNFLVATDGQRILGAVQLRRHPDGGRELGSLVVAAAAREQGIAARLIDALLEPQHAPVQMITDAAHALHYWRWGFLPIEPRRAPRSVRFNHWVGRLAGVISFFRRRPPRRLVILQRAGGAARSA